MDNSYFIGSCPICRQGMQEILKERETGELYICCDECEAEWHSPQDALADRSGSRFKYGLSDPASIEDIKKAGWLSYVKESP